ncbi:tetratricopeptide repeat protein [Anaerolineae bacterium CFX9]|nr:tetratricopeptide repeat protein [Geitlerinema splendidum]MDK3160727.1 tetratricopeptide repeat protein [Kamptonema cortianum]MDL1902353.1 tetratricopeptide repeat protein [Anaerolineae bacterium CFX9]
MKQTAFLVLMIAVLVSLSSAALAQEPSAEATAEAELAAAAGMSILERGALNLSGIPSTVRLEGLTGYYQDLNRCSAAALSIQLSYFGLGDYSAAVRALNTHEEDVAVRIEEMARYSEEQGLGAIVRYGGTIDMLKALVGSGFPVLVENVYYDGITGNPFRDFSGHNRVIMGYDDALGELYSFDPLLGHGPNNTGRPIPYDGYDARWRPFNYDYLVLYRPEDEALLQSVMGEHWDETFNLEYSLALSLAEIEEGRSDTFTLFNLGTTLTLLGRYEEAADYFDQALALGLPTRMLWYQYGVFDAYYALGRYDEMITLARNVIASTPGVEEMYYYIGLAAEATGDLNRAQANLEVATFRQRNYPEALEALVRVRAALAGT